MLYAVALTDGIIRAGAVAGAVMALAGAVAMLLRFSVKQFTRAVRDELGHVAPKIDQVYANTLELKPNGGSSLADAVRRLETSQLKISAELTAQRNALLGHLSDHEKHRFSA